MKKLMGLIVWGAMLVSCRESENTSEFTGNEATYALQPGSPYAVSGTVTIKERREGSATLIVKVTGTSGNNLLPLHLHLGDLSTPDAEIAALLNPVNAKTGISETILTQLADESSILYKDLLSLEACIKVHLSDVGPERSIILAGGNIGQAVKTTAAGRKGFGVCKSE